MLSLNEIPFLIFGNYVYAKLHVKFHTVKAIKVTLNLFQKFEFSSSHT